MAGDEVVGSIGQRCYHSSTRRCRVKCQVIWSLVVGTAAASGEDWMDPG